jgi:20S proteasome alpha/beta subunit
MTIIVGIEYSGGILIASDSQATAQRGAPFKRVAIKLRTLQSTVGRTATRIIMAGSGSDPYISRAAELMQNQCGQRQFGSPRMVAECLEDAVTELYKRYVVSRAAKLGTEVGEETLDVAFMLGVHCEGVANEPRSLYIVYPNGVAERELGYATIGSGAPYAEYLLARLYRESMALDFAVKTAVYVIEEVKKIDPYCGGQTHVAILTDTGFLQYEDAQINQLATALANQDAQVKQIWRFLSGDPEALRELQQAAHLQQQQHIAVPPPNPVQPEQRKDPGNGQDPQATQTDNPENGASKVGDEEK